jgi:hypothetical protein
LLADKYLTGNATNGRSTRRLESLSTDQRKQEKSEVFEAAVRVYESLNENDLTTLENISVRFLWKFID